MKIQQSFTNQPPMSSATSTTTTTTTSDSAFPILAVAVLSIIGTVFLLVCYYVFVSKCCSNWQHQINRLLLRRFSTLRARQYEESPSSFIAFSPTIWNRGLDEAVIRDIPAFLFRRGGEEQDRSVRHIYGCVVCLNEFQEQDMLRVLPKCSHAFHLDCIDIWLQSSANCPLCRTRISGTARYPIDQIIAPRSSPQGSQDSLMGRDEDFVVIELGGEDGEDGEHQIDNSGEVSIQPGSQSPKALERKHGDVNPRKRHHVSIMGDECIYVREKDNRFGIQPIKRSFSLDSAADRQLYLTVRTIIQQNGHLRKVSSTNEECSTRVRRSFFPFGHGRGGSRNAVLPIECEL